jgi:propanediol dehydratase small subunit
MDLYPLKEKHPEFIKSRSGKKLDQINMNGIMDGSITAEDIKISKEVLILQAEVARQDGKIQLARNFIRSAELIDIPDDRILEMYNALRPNRSTEEEFNQLIGELRNEYEANMCADLVAETLAVYKKRDLLRVKV